jgi:hypothetical protein
MALGSLPLVVLLSLGCGGGLSEDDAALRCDQEVAAKGGGGCITPGSAAYDECLSCFEECGDDCTPRAECPAKYTCPED